MYTPSSRFLALLALCGCYAGSLTDSVDTIDGRDLSGIAGRGSFERQPVAFAPRATFASENTLAALAFSTPEIQNGIAKALFDLSKRDSGISIFVNLQDDPELRVGPGLGPVMNQLSCVGCHRNTEIHPEVLPPEGLGQLTATESFLDSTPAGRAHRVAPPEQTRGQLVTLDDERGRNVETAAFTLFGDFSNFSGAFNGLAEFGGPVFHVRAVEGCDPDFILPESMDPNLVGPDVHRVVAERAAPPYVGRGLMEAVYWEDIASDEDPLDLVDDFAGEDASAALVPVSHPCAGDCLSGRQNQGRAANAIQGGDPVVRLARFGLRGAGTTLIQFMVGGSQGELGFSSPLNPNEPANPLNAANADTCFDEGPDPELSVKHLRDLRDVVRLVAPPAPGQELLGTGGNPGLAADVEAGARLFGLDLESFRDRMTGRVTTDASVPLDEARGRSTDPQLNCTGCHTPILATGISPAANDAYSEVLSNRWAPIFADLLLHDMGGFPVDFDEASLARDEPVFRGLSRNLADFALPGQGLATGTEWRTAPLMGLGKIGPPLMHDARVYVNPAEPQTYTPHNADLDLAGVPVRDRAVPILTVEEAILAAIEIHDLPSPPDMDGDGTPNYELCPVPGPDGDVCGRESDFRSEARWVMEKWRALTRDEQLQVVAFLQQL